jgi:hypothetical protein
VPRHLSLWKLFFCRKPDESGRAKTGLILIKQASLVNIPMKDCSATTLSIMTFSIMTLSITTFSITTISIMTISIMTLSIMTFSIIVNKTRHSA